MTLLPLIIPILMAAATPVADTPVAASPVVAAPAVDTSPPAKLEFPLAGYRINAYDSAPGQAFLLVFNLPGPDDENPPNVTVIILPPMGAKPTAQNMVKNTKSFHQQYGDTILAERTPSPTEWQAELTTKANQAGRKNHIYERVLIANGKTYKIDATAPDAQWPELGPKLKACVDSFDPSPEPAPGKTAFPHQGFRISALNVAAAEGKSQLQLEMDGVLVSVKPYAKTLKDYQAERRLNLMKNPPNNLIAANTKILAENMPTENTLVTEYAAELIQADKPGSAEQGHGYEKAVLAHGQLYLASYIQWDREKTTSYEQIKACVDSLEAIPTPADITAPAK